MKGLLLANNYTTIHDWYGQPIHSSIIRHISVGNIVRVVYDQEGSFYTRIQQIIGKNRHGRLYRGVIEDPYYGNDAWYGNRNGQKVWFSERSISELPLTWTGNSNLRRKARVSYV